MTPAEFAATHGAAFGNKGWDAAEFARLAAQTGVTIHGDPLSFVVIRQVADEAEVLTLATHPDARRRGRARAVLGAALDSLRRQGATRVFLDVAADNAAALALYTGAGFRPIAERKDYYRRPDGGRVTALVMRTDL